ncbi:MG2 domain-containing protein [Sandaracinus amylolyticus]|uniref:MG2 domain-containing protein n=1 Tax=Sandaracinus amylolyticus TaxID=927083 RepID=UPI0014706B2D|nr:MG2 domain-containing protein [Sandaracinus amylolyticus]
MDPASPVGYELALHGSTAAERGAMVRLHGTAYEVQGLSDLRPTPGLELDVTLTQQRRVGHGREVVLRAHARSVEQGRVTIEVPVPLEDLAAPWIEVHVHRAGIAGRVFRFPMTQLAARGVDVLTDRNRYQPGETVRVWSLVRAVRDRAPIPSAPIVFRLHDQQGTMVAERRTETGASGAASVEIVIPEGAALGRWTVQAQAEGAPLAARAITIVRRTVERLAVEVTLDREVLEPGAPLGGRVRVTTPSGTPVRGARVSLTVGDENASPLELVTDDEGIAVIDARAPSFLAGDAAPRQVIARVSHAAHGTLVGSAAYTLARTRWLVAATPEAGGLVPEIDTELYLAVSDPRGRPISQGVELEVRGLGVPNGRATARTDAHGLASVRVRLPRGAAARAQGGACAGQPATSFEVEVRTQPASTLATVCARVALEAGVLARARTPVVAPGSRVEIELIRRPRANGRLVLVEALANDRAVAAAWGDASARSVTLVLPADVQGVLRVRARPVSAADASRPMGELGAALIERGTITAILVRPADAFALDVTPERELHRVRERADVAVRASVSPERGWIALLARDEAAHGGESDFALEWIAGELRDVLRGPFDATNERYVRASLASSLPLDGAVTQPAPLVQEPWDTHESPTGSAPVLAGGVLRDPIAAREELRRRGLAPVMHAIERAVAQLGSDRAARDALVRTSGTRVELRPDVVERVVAMHLLAPSQALTLGGQPLTLAMITAADPSFTFDRIARRVARERLVRLLVALTRFANPDDDAALRASAGEPPERWLARVVQLGMLPADALIDPWGRPFALRRVGGRGPALVVSSRAVDYELASPGPDGRAGTADDVRDPFERAVPARTPYAVISGEDRLMEQLSRLAPGERVLQALVTAYRRLGLAAEEERRAGPVTATVSESDIRLQAELADMQAEADRMAREIEQQAMGGAAASGESVAYDFADDAEGGRGRRARDAPAREAPQAQAPAQPVAPDRLQAMGSVVREEFPATLFFVGEVALDASGTARITIPLADALTTYRLEAIGWTTSGWITSGRGRVRVDQEAMVDAPVPPAARIGDLMRLPVRVQNRTTEPLRARFEITIEGAAGLDVEPLAPIEIPPGDSREAIAVVRARAAGEGAIVVRALREDGTALDAVRRPIVVIEDARRVVEQRRELVGSGDEITIDVPARALQRGPGQLRVAVGGAIVGDPAEWASDGDAVQAAWALAMARRPMPDVARDAVLSQLPTDPGVDEGWFRGWDPLHLATLLGAGWTLPNLSEDAAAAALRSLATQLPEEVRDARIVRPDMPVFAPASAMLVALAPAIRDVDAHPSARDDLLRLVDRLRRLASAEGARASDAPATWARVAAALALSRRGADDPRASEMLRRAERHVFALRSSDGGDQAWLEPDADDGGIEPRVEPTAHLALARIAMGEPEGAMPLLRNIADIARGAHRWPPRVRALASAAAALLTRGAIESIAVTLDGRAIESALEGGVASATLDGLGAPGAHRIVITLPEGALALATIDLRYALPWDVAPARSARLDLAWTGETGARDVRSGSLLTVHNRGARVIARPIVEIELPAGAELDEPTREAMTALLAAPPELEGATLRLHLRPMAPGGFTAIPVRARWSVGGTLRGLGASAWDDAAPPRADVRAVSVLPSRELVIADDGPEPEPPEADASPPPEPRPPVPMPRPLWEVAR